MINAHVEKKNEVTIIHIFGILNAQSVYEAEKIWNEQITNKPEIIALDFSGIEYVDSMGISGLVKLSKSSIINEIELIFYGMSADVKDLFEVASLTEYFNILTKSEFEIDYI